MEVTLWRFESSHPHRQKPRNTGLFLWLCRSLHEIPLYLDSCADVYRPLAELLIATGMRISEALALRVGDVEIEPTGGLITVTVRTSARRSARRSSIASARWRSGRGLDSHLGTV